jgi:hypothetical protein
MAVPFWAPGSAASARAVETDWDVLVLGGQQLPGILSSLDGDKAVKLDESASAGADGATQTNLGNEPAQLSARLLLWTPEHLARWEAILPTLQSRDGGARPTPLDVYHPALAVMRIRSVFVKKVSVLKRSSTAGVFEVALELVEFSPKKATGTDTLQASSPAAPAAASAQPPAPPPSVSQTGPST